MVALVLMGLLLGAISRLRFEVLILVPAVILTWLFDSSDGAAYHFTASSALMTAALFAAALQLGYFGGAAVRSVLSLSRGEAQP